MYVLHRRLSRTRRPASRVVVWGDDFTFLGRERYLKEIGAKMAEWYDIKIRGMMGLDAGDDKEMRILNLGFDENTKSLDMPTAKD